MKEINGYKIYLMWVLPLMMLSNIAIARVEYTNGTTYVNGCLYTWNLEVHYNDETGVEESYCYTASGCGEIWTVQGAANPGGGGSGFNSWTHQAYNAAGVPIPHESLNYEYGHWPVFSKYFDTTD